MKGTNSDVIKDVINQRTRETYEQFVEKFKPKKTTDDCYTPDNIYEAIADWVANEYGLNRENFIRPFWPGADYTEYEYKEGQVVVDNPPFSIISKIIQYYSDNGIKFFLFCPGLTPFSSKSSELATVLCCGVNITYENGADICTSFVTNLEDEDLQLRTTPDLYKIIKSENDKNSTARSVPKYSYPDNVIYAAKVNQFSKYGVEFKVKKSESIIIAQLDSQSSHKKTIFGRGFLVSDELAAEKLAAEKLAAEKLAAEKCIVWSLSDREKEIIKNLGADDADE